ncbi:hypothetical protein VTK26DRAFT_1043 [Humicola hyalothermophila]
MSSDAQEQTLPMTEAVLSRGNLETGKQVIPAKRAALDDEIQFVSSNPVKKSRMTEQKPSPVMTERLPIALTTQKADGVKQAACFPHSTPMERCRSVGIPHHPSSHAAQPTFENRGCSLPALESYVFPQSLPPPIRTPRLSEAISPKQLPQTLPQPSEVSMSTQQPLAPAPGLPAQNSVGINQISCLDFNGIPINTPGFDFSKMFSHDGGIISGLAGPSPEGPPFNPSISPNAIPFTMFSTGSIVPMPPPPPPPSSSQRGAPTNPSPMQNSFQQSGLAPSLPGNGKHGPPPQPQHQHPQANPQGPHPHPHPNPVANRTPSPVPRSRPPCLHCARLRQETILRRAQGAAALQVHKNTTPATTPAPPNRPAASHLMNAPPPPHHQGPSPGPTAPGLRPGQSPPRAAAPMPGGSCAQGPPPPTQERHHHQGGCSAAPPSPSTASGTGATTPAPASVTAPTPISSRASLIADIAKTVQETFPYAQVAARRGVAQERVFDMVSGLVVLPLMMMRGANAGGKG